VVNYPITHVDRVIALDQTPDPYVIALHCIARQGIARQWSYATDGKL
jgi:hypothetical protein